ncbi:LuxR C-terminal-related transcriptional regulator [Blastococcus sp. SYSU DS0828]
MLIGRESELAVLREAVRTATTTGLALVVEGDAGLGKTALAAAATEMARSAGFRELRCSGVLGEASLGFAALHELLHPALHRVGALPARQRAALLTAFGLEEGPAPDPLLLSLAVLHLMEEVVATGPALVVVEDLHHVDQSSIDVLVFLARRLADLPLLLLATVRSRPDAPVPPADFPGRRLTLAPLTEAESQRLLEAVAPQLDPGMREAVVAVAGGNPLALTELATAPGAVRPAAAPALPDQLPTTARMKQAFLESFDQLPAASRQFLLVAAADGGNVPLFRVVAAAGGFDEAVALLRPVESAGLGAVTGGHFSFRHPLIGSAVYGAATSAERAAAHHLLAGLADDPERVAWHRAEASYGPDESVAAGLEAAAARALQRGARWEAFAAQRRAAALSPALGNRVRRLVSAAESARRAGLTRESVDALREAMPLADEGNAVRELALAEWALSSGTDLVVGRSPEELVAVAGRLGGPSGRDHPEARVQLLAAAATRTWELAAPETTRAAVRGGLETLDDTPHPLKTVGLALLDPSTRAAEPRSAPLELLDVVRTRYPWALASLAAMAEALHDVPASQAAWDAGCHLHAPAEAPGDAASFLCGRAAIRVLSGQLVDALADAGAAARTALDSELPLLAAAAEVVAARVHAWRGADAAAQAALRRHRELAGSHRTAVVSARAHWAAGLVAMNQRRYRAAQQEFALVGQHPTTAAWAVADLAEAAVRAGRGDSAAVVVADAERRARSVDSPYLWSLVHRARALLSVGEEAGEAYAVAVAAGLGSGAPLELARTRLVYGEWLRRQRRIAAAREQLAAALETLTAAGASPWADAAAAELRAAGGTPDAAPRRGAPPTELTTQERRIAELAAEGLTNREIAARTALSPRTVATHLARVFPKLDIAHRAQLRDALRTQPGGRGPAAPPVR